MGEWLNALQWRNEETLDEASVVAMEREMLDDSKEDIVVEVHSSRNNKEEGSKDSHSRMIFKQLYSIIEE